MKNRVESGLTIAFGLVLILFSQFVISQVHKWGDITVETLYGLLFLWIFAMLGIEVARIVKTRFPILGWVSITSLLFCLNFWPWSDFVVRSISAVNFLSMTTPVLAFAGLSVANRLGELKKMSWRTVIVGICVFTGTYLFSAVIAQFFLKISGS